MTFFSPLIMIVVNLQLLVRVNYYATIDAHPANFELFDYWNLAYRLNKIARDIYLNEFGVSRSTSNSSEALAKLDKWNSKKAWAPQGKILETPMSLIQPTRDLQCGRAAYPAEECLAVSAWPVCCIRCRLEPLLFSLSLADTFLVTIQGSSPFQHLFSNSCNTI